MSGMPQAPSGPLPGPDLTVALHADCAAAVRETMRRLRFRMVQGVATCEERRYYRTLWVACSLRRSACGRVRLESRLLNATTAYHVARAALLDEQARMEVEAAFGPGDDAPMEGAASHPH